MQSVICVYIRARLCTGAHTYIYTHVTDSCVYIYLQVWNAQNLFLSLFIFLTCVPAGVELAEAVPFLFFERRFAAGVEVAESVPY